MALEISELTDSLSNWELTGYVSVAAVAFGVAGESIHEFTKCLHSFPWWKEKGSKASALLLIVALAAELVIQIKVNSISGRVIALLNDGTEHLRRENLALEKRIAPRRFQQDEGNGIIHALSGLSEFKTVAIVSYAFDVESARLVGQLIDMLYGSPARMNLEKRAIPLGLGGAFLGISITGTNKPLVGAMLKAFDEIGHLEVTPDPVFKGFFQPGALDGITADAIIFVGAKPIR